MTNDIKKNVIRINSVMDARFNCNRVEMPKRTVIDVEEVMANLSRLSGRFNTITNMEYHAPSSIKERRVITITWYKNAIQETVRTSTVYLDK